MKLTKLWAALALFCSVSSLSWAATDTTPDLLSLSLFGSYATPLEPQDFARLATDGSGFEFLAEWNASYNASIGLNFETTSFYYGTGSSASVLGLEGRLFAFPNGKSPFSPYFSAGAGLGLTTGLGNEVKLGLGSRIRLVSPVFLDLTVGSHWFDSGLQFADFRAGLSLSFDLVKGSSSSNPPKATPTAGTPTITPTPAMKTSVTPTATLATATTTPTPVLSLSTPTPIIESIDVAPAAPMAPALALSTMKMYYKKAVTALKIKDYPTALVNYKKALSIQDKHVPSFYYAESNATIGIIYQYHSQAKGHKALAMRYYEKALKIDPATQSAKIHLKKLKSEMAPPVKMKKVKKKVPAAVTPTAPASSDAASSAPADSTVSQPAAKADAGGQPPTSVPAASSTDSKSDAPIHLDMGN